MKPHQVSRVMAAVKAGFNVFQITRGTSTQKAIVAFNALKRRRIEDPALDRFIIKNARGALSRSQLMKFRIVPANASFFCLRTTRVEIPQFVFKDGDYNWVMSLIPRYFPSNVREDIMQDIFEALIRRSISREQLPSRILDFVSAHRRTTDHPGLVDSLDEPLSWDSKVTRIANISRGLWD
jgi:hypothetical protein